MADEPQGSLNVTMTLSLHMLLGAIIIAGLLEEACEPKHSIWMCCTAAVTDADSHRDAAGGASGGAAGGAAAEASSRTVETSDNGEEPATQTEENK